VSEDAGQDVSSSKDAAIADAKSGGDASNTGMDAAAPTDGGVIDATKPCTADTKNDPMNCGVCGRVCNAGGCDGGECQHVVFATLPPGNSPAFGGVDGGDAICQMAAASGGLHGPFFAWLGTSYTDPERRFVHGTRSYVLPGGAMTVANDWGQLTSGGLQKGIDVDPNGVAVGFGRAWTNVNSSGGTFTSGNGNACGDWTSTQNSGVVGNVGGSGSGWSSSTNNGCGGTNIGLYCVEQ
jgi:hypothetical protein